MKRVFKILILMLIPYNLTIAQLKPSARESALSFSDIASSQNVFATFYNPSVLTGVKSAIIGISYYPSLYGLKELSTGYFSFIYPNEFCSAAAGIMIYGFELYKETQFTVSLSKLFYNNYSFGITAIYKHLSIKNYGSKGFFIFNLGSNVTLSKYFNLGFLIENFTRTTINNESNQFPIAFSAGIHFKPIDDVNIFASINKELNYELSLRTGIEYYILNYLALRIGTTNQPEGFSGGFGFAYKLISIDYASIYYLDLGITHQFSLIIQF